MRERDNYLTLLRQYSNSAKYGKAHRLAKKLRRLHPEEPMLAYYEAVMFGDDEAGRSPQEIKVRHRKAARMLKPWLQKLRKVDPNRRRSFRNEYYWFSHQPVKQYRLGLEW